MVCRSRTLQTFQSQLTLLSFYCIVLLSSLFLSSCYWQPVPLDSPLSSPWSENVTTFAEALNSSLSFSVQPPIPSTIHPVDRCWCEFSLNNLFEPFNVTDWERSTVEWLKGEQRESMRTLVETIEADDVAKQDLDADDSAALSLTNNRTTILKSLLRAIYRRAHLPSPLPSPLAPPTSSIQADHTPVKAEQNPPTPAPSDKRPSRPWLRREYDLREYGMDLIVDFGWSRRRTGRNERLLSP
jgi:hypothetical protein